MTQTEERALREFYQTTLLPVVEALRARDTVRLRVANDDAPSWYVDYPDDAVELCEIEVADCAPALRSLWVAAGLPELADVAAGLVDAATRLGAQDNAVSEISPFVYVMY